MPDLNKKMGIYNNKRLEAIGRMLKEMRFSEGRRQDQYLEYGASRRQIQRGEYGFNITLKSLFNLLDCYGYTPKEFFQDID